MEVTRRTSGRDDTPDSDIIVPSRRDDGTRRNAKGARAHLAASLRDAAKWAHGSRNYLVRTVMQQQQPTLHLNYLTITQAQLL